MPKPNKYTPRTNTDLFKDKPRTKESLRGKKIDQFEEDRMRRALSLPTDKEIKDAQKDNPTL